MAGALAEMKKYILPKYYPELNFSRMRIYLLEAAAKVLNGYSEASSIKGKKYLDQLGVEVMTDTFVKDYDGKSVLLAKNIKRQEKGQPLKAFKYLDKGSLATVGRNLAVADLPFISFQGFFAWVLWLFVHLMAILGVKNRLFVFINWAWSYLTYDQSLRLLIKPKKESGKEEVKNII